MPTTPALRRRFRFGLRTLFVLMTIVALATWWWIAAQRNWAAQRHAFLSQADNVAAIVFKVDATPWPLQHFGGYGVKELRLSTSAASEVKAEAVRLFPEAKISPP